MRVKPDIAQQVQHDGRRVLARRVQGQASHGMHLQVKLRKITGIQGVVAAVVRARRHFVDDERAAVVGVGAAVFNQKKFNTQHAHVVNVICY